MDDWVSVSDAARLLGYTVQHTRLLIRTKKLKAEKKCGVWFISREYLLELMSTRSMPTLFPEDKPRRESKSSATVKK